MTRRFLMVVCAFFVLNSTLAVAQKSGIPLDQIAVVVNNDIITRSEWLSESSKAQRELARLPADKRPSAKALQGEILNVLVMEKLQMEAADRLQIEIGSAELNQAIGNIAARNKLKVEQLKAILKQQGQSYAQFEAGIAKQMRQARLRDKVTQSVRITEQEIELYKQSADFKQMIEKASQSKAVQTKARHILIRVTADLDDSEARIRITRLRERIIAGEDFADIARAQSDDVHSGSLGGDLGWVAPGQLTPAFETEMNELPLKQLSQPIRSPFGWHLIEVFERKDGIPSAEAENLLAQEAIFRRKANQVWNEWLDRLRSDAYVEVRL